MHLQAKVKEVVSQNLHMYLIYPTKQNETQIS